jgi:thymidylate kinase
MEKILILIPILILIFSAGSVQAKFPDDLPGPQIMPDSSFYFLKIWYEKIVLFFTFDVVKKAERYKTFAEKRAYEAKEMFKQGKDELAEKTKEIYKSYLDKARERLEKAVQKAMRQGREKLQQELEQKVDEIKNKIKEAVNLW